MIAKYERLIQGILEKGFGMVDQFLMSEEVDQLRKDFLTVYDQHAFKLAGIGQGGDFAVENSVRGDLIHWLSESPQSAAQEMYFNRIREFILYLNQTCFLSINGFELHYAMYTSGTFYKKHLDRFQGDDSRLLSIICYLNEDWKEQDGGQLKIYTNNGGEALIDPIGGRVVCFESGNLPHEVLPSTRDRLSITGWLKHTRVSLI